MHRWPAPPRNVRVVEHDDGLEVRLRWFDDVSPLGVALNAALVAVLAGCAWVMTQPLGLGLAVLLVVVFGYLLLTSLVNTTTVWIGREGIEVTSGPLPSLQGTQVVPRRQLDALSVGVDRHGGRYWRKQWVSYRLETPGADGVLMTKWRRRESLTYVRDLVRHRLVRGAAR